MKKSYRDYLLDIKWITKAKFIRQRDNHTCKSCGIKNVELHVHHQRYYKNHKPWEVENKYLITLCEPCHKKEHEGKNINEFIYYKPKSKKKAKKVRVRISGNTEYKKPPISKKLEKRIIRKTQLNKKIAEHKEYVNNIDSYEKSDMESSIKLYIELININEKKLSRKMRKKRSITLSKLRRKGVEKEYKKQVTNH